MTSSVKNSIPQLVWWMTKNSRVPAALVRGFDATGEGSAAELVRERRNDLFR